MGSNKLPRVSIGFASEIASQLRHAEAGFDVTRDLLTSYAASRVADLKAAGSPQFSELGSGDRILFIINQLALESNDGSENLQAELQGLKLAKEQAEDRSSKLEDALRKQQMMAQNFFECLILAGGGEPPPR